MNTVVKYLAIAAVSLFALYHFSDNDADVDLWGNVGFVTSLPGSESFRRANTFSYTEPDRAWINHEWLGQYIFRKAFDAAGNAGLLMLKTVLGLCVLGLMEGSMRRSGVSGTTRFLALILIVSTMGYGFSVRPHHFTYVLLAMFLFLLKHYSRSPVVMLAAIPALGVLWVNLHGAFFIGISLVLLYALPETARLMNSRRGKPRLIVPWASLGLLIAASMVNPYMAETWHFIFRSAAVARRQLSEWAMFDPLRHILIHPDFMFLALLSAAAVALGRGQSATWTAILAASFVSALVLRRNIPLFAITAGFVIPELLDNRFGSELGRLLARMGKPALAICLAVFAGISAAYGVARHIRSPLEITVDQTKFPVETVSFMKANRLSGNLLVFFDWAEYCIWKLYPDCRVFIDGRLISAYGADTCRDYFDFIYRQGNPESALSEYPTDTVLIHRNNPAYGAMAGREGWTLVFQSGIAALFVRNEAHAVFLRRFDAGECEYPERGEHEYFP